MNRLVRSVLAHTGFGLDIVVGIVVDRPRGVVEDAKKRAVARRGTAIALALAGRSLHALRVEGIVEGKCTECR